MSLLHQAISAFVGLTLIGINPLPTTQHTKYRVEKTPAAWHHVPSRRGKEENPRVRNVINDNSAFPLAPAENNE